MNEKLLAAIAQLTTACTTAAARVNALWPIVRDAPSFTDTAALMAATVAQSLTASIRRAEFLPDDTMEIPVAEYSRLNFAHNDSEIALTKITATFACLLASNTGDQQFESALQTLLIYLGWQVIKQDVKIAILNRIDDPTSFLGLPPKSIAEATGLVTMDNAFDVVYSHMKEHLARTQPSIEALFAGESVEGVSPETLGIIRSALDADQDLQKAYANLVVQHQN